MKVIICCGQENRSPFCAMCGARLQSFPLSDLLNYCREQADKHEVVVKKMVDSYGAEVLGPLTDSIRALLTSIGLSPATTRSVHRNPLPSERTRITKARDEAIRWRSYATALERLMRYASTLPPEGDGAAGAPPSDPAGGRNLEI